MPSTKAHSEIAAARVGIRTTLDSTLAALRRGASAQEVADLIFTEDVVIAVGGYKTFHGLAQFMPTLAEWVREPIASWTIEEPFKVSGGLAVVYILERIIPKKEGEPPPVYRSLWVFETGPKGWRCSREALVGVSSDHS